MSNSPLCQLLKNHIDNLWHEHKLNYKDIAKTLNLNINSVRTGVYNDRLGLEKLCKIAIVSGFPLMRYANELVSRYPSEIKNLEDAKARIRTYNAALQDKIMVTYDDNEAYKEAFDLALRESTEDTATVVMLAKMRRSVGERDIEDNNTLKELTRMQGQFDEHSQEHKEIYDKMQRVQEDYNENKIGKVPVKIPVPEELGELVEAVTGNEEPAPVEETKACESETKSCEAEEEENMKAAEVEKLGKAVAEKMEKPMTEDKILGTRDDSDLPEAKDVIRPVLKNISGMEAVLYYETFVHLWNYGCTGSVLNLYAAVDGLADLLKEVDTES